MNNCPGWIFDVAVAAAAEEFLAGELPLQTYCEKYAEGLAQHYLEIDVGITVMAQNVSLNFSQR